MYRVESYPTNLFYEKNAVRVLLCKSFSKILHAIGIERKINAFPLVSMKNVVHAVVSNRNKLLVFET